MSEMPQPIKNKLSGDKRYKLNTWLVKMCRQLKKEESNPTVAQVAEMATQQLKFDVTASNIDRARLDTKESWFTGTRPRRRISEDVVEIKKCIEEMNKTIVGLTGRIVNLEDNYLNVLARLEALEKRNDGFLRGIQRQ